MTDGEDKRSQPARGGDVAALRGSRVDDVYGHVIGHVHEIHMDEHTGLPAWLAVEHPTGPRLIPYADTTGGGDYIWVPYESSVVLAAPPVRAGAAPSAELERELRAHYDTARDELTPQVPPPAPRPPGGHAHRVGHRRRSD